MRRLSLLLLLVTLACGGSRADLAGTPPEANTVEPASMAVAAPEPAAATEPKAVPKSATSQEPAPSAPLDCARIKARYQQLVSRTSCQTDADCHMVDGQCSLGLGGCAHAVNTAVTERALSSLGQFFQAGGCATGRCRCRRIASDTSCVAGRCQPARAASPSPKRPDRPSTPGRTAPPTRCPALGCALPPDCFEPARDANGCPTCRCAR